MNVWPWDWDQHCLGEYARLCNLTHMISRCLPIATATPIGNMLWMRQCRLDSLYQHPWHRKFEEIQALSCHVYTDWWEAKHSRFKPSHLADQDQLFGRTSWLFVSKHTRDYWSVPALLHCVWHLASLTAGTCTFTLRVCIATAWFTRLPAGQENKYWD